MTSLRLQADIEDLKRRNGDLERRVEAIEADLERRRPGRPRKDQQDSDNA